MSAFVAMNSATRPVVDPRRESKNDEKSLQRLIAIVCAGDLVPFKRIALFDPSPSRVILETWTL